MFNLKAIFEDRETTSEREAELARQRKDEELARIEAQIDELQQTEARAQFPVSVPEVGTKVRVTFEFEEGKEIMTLEGVVISRWRKKGYFPTITLSFYYNKWGRIGCQEFIDFFYDFKLQVWKYYRPSDEETKYCLVTILDQ